MFSCYILHVIYVLLTETNRYYHQHLDRHDKTPNPLPDIMNTKMFLFLAIIVQMGNNICDRLMDYQTRTEQFFSPFYWKATTYVTEWRTIKQGQNNFSHLSIGRPQHMWQTEGLSNKDRTIFLTFLPEYNDTRPFLAHLVTLSAFQRQWHKTQHEWQQLWQTVGNKRSLWYPQCCMLKILQSFWTSGTWPGDYTKGKVAFQRYIPKNH